MGLIQEKISVAAGATSENIFEGTEYEFLSVPAKITVSAIAESGGDGYLRWTVGSVVMIDKAYMKQGSDYPVIPDNILDSENVPAGQRQILQFTNDNSAAKSFWVRLDIDFYS